MVTNCVPLPDGDVLIHAGDYSVFGRYDETKEFLEWFVNQHHPHKIIVFGNHEVGVERIHATGLEFKSTSDRLRS